MLTESQTIFPAPQTHDGQEFAALRRVGLGDAELTAISRQGYVQRDRRLGGNSYWRLRFRFQQRMRTVYLGNDERIVAECRRELIELQAPKQRSRQLARSVRDGKRALRKAKARLEPLLGELGFHYHGDRIRRIRNPRAELSEQMQD